METQSPRRQVPGHTITLKLWGRGTGICTGIPQNSSWQWGCYCFILAKPPFQVAGPRLPAPPPRAALPGPARTPQPRAPQPCAPPATRWLGLCPAGLHRAKALTSAGLRSPRACAEPDKWYAMTRGMITLLLLVIIRVNAI